MSEGGNGRTWTADIKDLGEKIVGLTVAKAKELGDYLEEVHGIKPADQSSYKVRKFQLVFLM